MLIFCLLHLEFKTLLVGTKVCLTSFSYVQKMTCGSDSFSFFEFRIRDLQEFRLLFVSDLIADVVLDFS